MRRVFALLAIDVLANCGASKRRAANSTAIAELSIDASTGVDWWVTSVPSPLGRR
jgi:hypothetical protein